MASEKVSFDLSGDLNDVLRYSIDINTERQRKSLSAGGDNMLPEDEAELKNRIRLNEKLLSTLDKYMTGDGKITLYTSEIHRLVRLLLENELFRME